MIKAIGVIPARFGSTRFPGKPLKLISGKPLLGWVIEAAKKTKRLNEIVVATDHEEIMALAKAYEVQAIMTDSDLPSGTDRVWAAAKDMDAEVVINIQGDEPLLKPELLDELVMVFEDQPGVKMATLGREFNSEEDFQSKNTAKIVLNKNGQAIYFSRWQIPFSRLSFQDQTGLGESVLKHIGIYGFRKNFLKSFCEQVSTPLEQAEGLEQLRALYMGESIQVIKVDYESWGVDTPEDIQRVEGKLKNG